MDIIFLFDLALCLRDQECRLGVMRRAFVSGFVRSNRGLRQDVRVKGEDRKDVGIIRWKRLPMGESVASSIGLFTSICGRLLISF